MALRQLPESAPDEQLPDEAEPRLELLPGLDDAEAVEEAEALAPLRPAEIFGAMFAEMTPQLREQQRELAAAGEEGVEG